MEPKFSPYGIDFHLLGALEKYLFMSAVNLSVYTNKNFGLKLENGTWTGLLSILHKNESGYPLKWIITYI